MTDLNYQILNAIALLQQEEYDRRNSFKVVSFMDYCKEHNISVFPHEKKEKDEMEINIKGTSVTHKPRADGRYQGYYQVENIKKYVYGRTIDEVKNKIQKLIKDGIPAIKKSQTKNGAPTNFNDFTMFVFNNFRKRKVATETYRSDVNRFNNYLKPAFENKKIAEITALDCQNLIDSIVNAGKGKTADEIYSILNIIFNYAIKYGLIKNNPLEIVFHTRHIREHGTALTLDEIKELLGDKNEYRSVYALMLFTGARPNELSTVDIKTPFIVMVNSKRKNGKTEYKKIPIMHELLPYLDDYKKPNYESLRKHFKSIFPNHTLKDLRKTFNSRCIECGINETARKLWIGHSLGELGTAYTELSDEFMLEEAKKFFYFSQF